MTTISYDEIQNLNETLDKIQHEKQEFRILILN